MFIIFMCCIFHAVRTLQLKFVSSSSFYLHCVFFCKYCGWHLIWPSKHYFILTYTNLISSRTITVTWTSSLLMQPWIWWMKTCGSPTTCTWKLLTSLTSGLFQLLLQQVISFECFNSIEVTSQRCNIICKPNQCFL